MADNGGSKDNFCVVCGQGSSRSDWQGKKNPACDHHTEAEIKAAIAKALAPPPAPPAQKPAVAKAANTTAKAPESTPETES